MSPNQKHKFNSRVWQLAHGKSLELGPVSRIMGILNVTPDSFSDGGRYINLADAVDHAAKMISEGADIIDIGGESTKPGATKVDLSAEQDRVLPVIDALKDRFDVIISIDTYHATTADLAIKAGAHLVNDVRALQYDDKVASVVAKHQAGVCIMHNSRERQVDDDLVRDQMNFLSASVSIADGAGINSSCIVLDPGLGFGKNAQENLELLGRFDRLHQLELPLLIGASRKRFTAEILEMGHDNEKTRDIVTTATSVIARMAGCSVFRVHDVAMNKHALNMADAVIHAG